MNTALFNQLPWLLLEKQLVACSGYAPNTVDKLVDCGVLEAVKPAGSHRRRFRKTQVSLLLGLGDLRYSTFFAMEPFLLGEKSVMAWTGYSRRTLRKMAAAGGLHMVKPPGLTAARYRKIEIAELLGLSRD